MPFCHHQKLSDIITEVSNDACRSIGTEDICSWAERNIVLAGSYGSPGPLRLGTSRYLMEPLRAMQDWQTKEVVILKATQTAGTLSAEIFLQWALVNRPVPTLWIGQSDKMAEIEMSTRLRPSILSNKELSKQLPDDSRLIRKDGFDLAACNFRICGPALNNLQSSTRGIVIADELAYWDDSNLLAEAKQRMNYYDQYGMSKLIVVSQAGEVDNELDKEWKTTTMEEWSVPCIGCGKYWTPNILNFNAGGKSWSDDSLKLKNSSNEYNIGKLQKILTLECPNCKYLHTDTPQVKQKWNSEGKYIATNPDAIDGCRGFRWSAIPMTPWIKIVAAFLNATAERRNGLDEPFLQFFQKRMAIAINPREYFAKDKQVKSDVPYDKDKWPEEKIRCFTIDVQESHFVGVIRAWSQDGKSHQLWTGKLNTIEEVLAKQKEFNIPYLIDNYGRKCYMVGWDTGFGQRSREVYRYIIDYNHIGLKGEPFKPGYVETKKRKDGTTYEVYRLYRKSLTGGDPDFGTKNQGKTICPLYLLAVDGLKKILISLREGKGSEWLCLPIDSDIMKEYNTSMFSEEYVQVERNGKRFGEWQKISKTICNDFWDAEVYNLALARLAGINIKEAKSVEDPNRINPPESVTEQNKEPDK